jgi:hypothetical protein
MKTYEELLAQLEQLRAEATTAGFELFGTILTAEESAITDLVIQSDDLYDKLCNHLEYACEELNIDSEGYLPCVSFVKAID